MITPGNLETLSHFDPAPFLVTSLYLNTDLKRFPKPALLTLLKDLVRERLAELRNAGLTHDQLKSVESDLERLHDALSGHAFNRTDEKGLAIFACAGRDFFQSWALPHGFKATLLVGPTPYLRPLNALLAQSPHAFTVLVDQKHARGYRLHGEEIHDAFELTHETGSRIRKGGIGGKDERHIEHHHDEAVHHHYQDVADRLLKTFQTAPFEHLVLAGHLDELRDFERHLHTWLSERLTGRFRVDLRTARRDEVGARTLELVTAAEKSRREDTVRRLVGASRTNGGLAVAGLRSTLAALNDRRVASLLVEEDLRAHGRRCAACDTVYEKETACARCSQPTQDTADVVDEAIALTVHQGGSIRILPPNSELAPLGKIGAMLRY